MREKRSIGVSRSTFLIKNEEDATIALVTPLKLLQAAVLPKWVWGDASNATSAELEQP
jgi:hypothetical protein